MEMILVWTFQFLKAQQLAQRRDTQFLLQVGPWKLGLSFFSISCMTLLWCDVPVYLGLEITI